MDANNEHAQHAEIGAGLNGEVWPCPECHQHESVKWLPGNDYRYKCTECDIVFTPEDSKQGFES